MPSSTTVTSRRRFLATTSVTTLLPALTSSPALAAPAKPFKLNFILASSMYGKLPIDTVLTQLKPTDATHIDIWPASHANHREQIEKLGHDKFSQLLKKHNAKVGIYTVYNPGILKSKPWMPVCKKFGGSILVANAPGPRNLTGKKLQTAVDAFAKKLDPILKHAESHNLKIAIENHSGSLINSPEAQQRLLKTLPNKNLGIALAPYHLPQDPKLLSDLILKLNKRLFHFYAWQHGMGCSKKLPKHQELLQMPGRGSLNFAPLVAALRKINYAHWTSPFMHPVPRGIPILPTAKETTKEILRAQTYLSNLIPKSA